MIDGRYFRDADGHIVRVAMQIDEPSIQVEFATSKRQMFGVSGTYVAGLKRVPDIEYGALSFLLNLKCKRLCSIQPGDEFTELHRDELHQLLGVIADIRNWGPTGDPDAPSET